MTNILHEMVCHKQAHEAVPNMVPRLEGIVLVHDQKNMVMEFALYMEFVGCDPGSTVPLPLCKALHLQKRLQYVSWQNVSAILIQIA